MDWGAFPVQALIRRVAQIRIRQERRKPNALDDLYLEQLLEEIRARRKRMDNYKPARRRRKSSV